MGILPSDPKWDNLFTDNKFYSLSSWQHHLVPLLPKSTKTMAPYPIQVPLWIPICHYLSSFPQMQMGTTHPRYQNQIHILPFLLTVLHRRFPQMQTGTIHPRYQNQIHILPFLLTVLHRRFPLQYQSHQYHHDVYPLRLPRSFNPDSLLLQHPQTKSFTIGSISTSSCQIPTHHSRQ